MGFPSGSYGKESACKAGDPSLIPGLGRYPEEWNGYLLQYSCLGNPMDRGAWWAPVLRVAKSQTQLKQHSPIAPACSDPSHSPTFRLYKTTPSCSCFSVNNYWIFWIFLVSRSFILLISILCFLLHKTDSMQVLEMLKAFHCMSIFQGS